MSIEDLAHKHPEKIVRVPVDIREGITHAQAALVVDALRVKGDRDDAIAMVSNLYRLFAEKDCTLVEVNPLAETHGGKLVAADAKLGFDDNAAFRQAALFDMRDETQEDPKEVAAGKHDLNYIALDGSIACMGGCTAAGEVISSLEAARGQGYLCCSAVGDWVPPFFCSQWRRPGNGDDGHHQDARGNAGKLP